MTSFFTGLRAGVAVASITGVLAMAGCPGGDDSSSDTTQSMTTMTGDTGADTGMQETGTPTDESGDTGSAPAYADIQAIWDEHCTAACHETGGEWALLIMTSDSSYTALQAMSTQATDLKFIEPNDTDASYLWHKINGTHASVGGSGNPMPAPAGGLDAGTIATIEAWISGGAQP